MSEALSYINQILKYVPDWREAKILQIECLAKMGLAERVRTKKKKILHIQKKNYLFIFIFS